MATPNSNRDLACEERVERRQKQQLEIKAMMEHTNALEAQRSTPSTEAEIELMDSLSSHSSPITARQRSQSRCRVRTHSPTCARSCAPRRRSRSSRRSLSSISPHLSSKSATDITSCNLHQQRPLRAKSTDGEYTPSLSHTDLTEDPLKARRPQRTEQLLSRSRSHSRTRLRSRSRTMYRGRDKHRSLSRHGARGCAETRQKILDRRKGLRKRFRDVPSTSEDQTSTLDADQADTRKVEGPLLTTALNRLVANCLSAAVLTIMKLIHIAFRIITFIPLVIWTIWASFVKFYGKYPLSYKHALWIVVAMLLFRYYSLWVFLLQPNLSARFLSSASHLVCWISHSSFSIMGTVASTLSGISNITTTSASAILNITSLPPWLVAVVCSQYSLLHAREACALPPLVGDKDKTDSPIKNAPHILTNFANVATNENTNLLPMVTQLTYSGNMVDSFYALVSTNDYLFGSNKLSASAEKYVDLCSVTQEALSYHLTGLPSAISLLSIHIKYARQQLLDIEAKRQRRDQRWLVRAAMEETWIAVSGLVPGIRHLSYKEEVLEVYDYWISNSQEYTNEFVKQSGDLVHQFQDLHHLIVDIHGLLTFNSYVAHVSDESLGKWFVPENWGSDHRSEHDRVKVRLRIIADGATYIENGIKVLTAAHNEYKAIKIRLDETYRLISQSRQGKYQRRSSSSSPSTSANANTDSNANFISNTVTDLIKDMAVADAQLRAAYDHIRAKFDVYYDLEQRAREERKRGGGSEFVYNWDEEFKRAERGGGNKDANANANAGNRV